MAVFAGLGAGEVADLTDMVFDEDVAAFAQGGGLGGVGEGGVGEGGGEVVVFFYGGGHFFSRAIACCVLVLRSRLPMSALDEDFIFS